MQNEITLTAAQINSVFRPYASAEVEGNSIVVFNDVIGVSVNSFTNLDEAVECARRVRANYRGN